MRDTIGNATVIKHIPQDKRLQIAESKTLTTKLPSESVSPSISKAASTSNIITATSTSSTKTASSISVNAIVSPLQKIESYGSVIDVPADGSCGYHAVAAILEEKGVIDVMPVNMFRQQIRMFIENNKENVVKTLDYCVRFQNTRQRALKIDRYLNTTMDQIFKNNIRGG